MAASELMAKKADCQSAIKVVKAEAANAGVVDKTDETKERGSGLREVWFYSFANLSQGTPRLPGPFQRFWHGLHHRKLSLASPARVV